MKAFVKKTSDQSYFIVVPHVTEIPVVSNSLLRVARMEYEAQGNLDVKPSSTIAIDNHKTVVIPNAPTPTPQPPTLSPQPPAPTPQGSTVVVPTPSTKTVDFDDTSYASSTVTEVTKDVLDLGT